MRSTQVRDARAARLREPHIAPITRYVDDLRARRGGDTSIPYVDPDTGGTQARALLLLQDPGPKASITTGGSGMLSWSNDDATAANCCRLLEATHLPWSLLLPWNIIPWHTGGEDTAGDREAGYSATAGLLRLLPSLSAVVVMGVKAQKGWTQLQRTHPEARSLKRFNTLHPSVRGLTRGSTQPMQQGFDEVEAVLKSLHDYLRPSDQQPG